MKLYDLVVIGGGIGGSAAAFRAAQNGMSVAWIMGDQTTRVRSRSQWVYNLDNIIGYHEGVVKDQILKTLKRAKEMSAYELVKQQEYRVNNKGIIANTVHRIEEKFPEVVFFNEAANDIRQLENGFEVITETQIVRASTAVLATGMMDMQPNILKTNKRGELVDNPSWIYPYANKEKILYCIRCEGHLTQNERVGVIGHNNTAAEIAFLFKERYQNEVCILANDNKIEISERRKFLLEHYKIPVYKSKIIDIINKKKELRGFELQDQEEGTVVLKFALVSLGIFKVYNELAVKLGCELLDEEQELTQRYVSVNRFGESSVSGFYVVGDAASRLDGGMMKQVYTAQEYAVRAVDQIDQRQRNLKRGLILKQFKK